MFASSIVSKSYRMILPTPHRVSISHTLTPTPPIPTIATENSRTRS